MKISILVVAVVLAASPSVIALAQSAPLRGVGLLALGASDTRPAASGSALVDVPDSGGGSTGAHALRGADGDATAARDCPDADANPVPDALPARSVPSGDPTAPVATPKRPSYRWQSLVPGAIK